MKATTKLVIYTLVGSLLMLAGAVATGVLAAEHSGGAHHLRALRAARAAARHAARRSGSSCCFAAAFLVKMPAFPLHGWMPDGYRAMPIEVLMVFSRRALEGRRLRLPGDRAAAVSRRPPSTSRR